MQKNPQPSPSIQIAPFPYGTSTKPSPPILRLGVSPVEINHAPPNPNLPQFTRCALQLLALAKLLAGRARQPRCQTIHAAPRYALDKLQVFDDRLDMLLIARLAYRSPEPRSAVGDAPNSELIDAAALNVALANHDSTAFEAAVRAVGVFGLEYYPVRASPSNPGHAESKSAERRL